MPPGVHEIIDRLEAAYNAHDVDAFVALFAEDYTSEQPAHPARSFQGLDRLRANWSNVFTTVPDLQAERLRMAVDGDEAWVEWRWSGTSVEGTVVDLRGVTVFGIADGTIAWGRLFMEDVEEPPGGGRGGDGFAQARQP